MGFNPAWWVAAAIACALAYLSVTDPYWKMVCLWGGASFVVIFTTDVLRRLLELELQSPIKRKEEQLAVRRRELQGGITEYRICVNTHGFRYNQVDSEEMNGRLIRGKVTIESK